MFLVGVRIKGNGDAVCREGREAYSFGSAVKAPVLSLIPMPSRFVEFVVFLACFSNGIMYA